MSTTPVAERSNEAERQVSDTSNSPYLPLCKGLHSDPILSFTVLVVQCQISKSSSQPVSMLNFSDSEMPGRLPREGTVLAESQAE